MSKTIDRLDKQELRDDIKRMRKQLNDILVDLDWLVEDDREYGELFEKLDRVMNRADHYFSRLLIAMTKDINKLRD